MSGSILFLDLATTTGWCEGVPGEKPTSGTVRLAPPGSSVGAKMGGLFAFLGTRLTAFRYRAIVYEAPLDPRHMGKHTNLETAFMLIGLCGVAEAVAHQTGHWTVKKADAGSVRKHLIGRGIPAGEAKAHVIRAIRTIGFDPKDDNEADAIAGWIYASSILDPKTGAGSTPLFRTVRS